MYEISCTYLQVLGTWFIVLLMLLLIKVGNQFLRFLTMTITILIATKKLRKNLAKTQDVINKHFKMFSGKGQN